MAATQHGKRTGLDGRVAAHGLHSCFDRVTACNVSPQASRTGKAAEEQESVGSKGKAACVRLKRRGRRVSEIFTGVTTARPRTALPTLGRSHPSGKWPTTIMSYGALRLWRHMFVADRAALREALVQVWRLTTCVPHRVLELANATV